MLRILHSNYFAETYPDEWNALTRIFAPDQLSANADDFPQDSIILPRYRAIPFGDELEQQINTAGSRLINTWEQHQALDNLLEWSHLLGHLTAKTYTLEDFHNAPEGAYFVKGEVNSMKNRGPSRVYAASKSAAYTLAQELSEDSWLNGQTIVLRELQDYLRLGTTRNNLPIFHEQRVFAYRGNILSTSFYWGSHAQLEQSLPPLDKKFYQALEDAFDRIGHLADFMVIDMAQYTDGHWGVVELNDASMSGIPTISPYQMYSNLAKYC